MASKPSTSRPAFRKPALNKALISEILRSGPENEGFHLYLAIGKPTEQNAVSLTDFVDKLATVNVQSVDFHYPRKDFEKWIREGIGDTELALRLGRIGRIRLGTRGEALRREMLQVAKFRLDELKAAL